MQKMRMVKYRIGIYFVFPIQMCKGKIDRIIAKSISRFARNTKECLTVIRELNDLGITVFFEKENSAMRS